MDYATSTEAGLDALLGASPAPGPETVIWEPDHMRFTLDTRRYLAARLEYDAELDSAFCEWEAQVSEDDPYGAVAASHLEAATVFVQDVLGVPEAEIALVNTYDGESVVHRVLQYLRWDDESGVEHVALQVHTGVDVRAGYSRPVFFQSTAEEFGHDVGHADLACPEGHSYLLVDNTVYDVQNGWHLSGAELSEYYCPECRSLGHQVRLSAYLPNPAR